MGGLIRRIFRRGPSEATERDEALRALHKLERSKAHEDRHDENPNEGYATPFEGGQYPGTNLGQW